MATRIKNERDNQSKLLGYQVILPDGYGDNRERQWPLILFLHGSGRRGDKIGDLDGYGLNGVAENQIDFQFIVLTPQCPVSEDWSNQIESLINLLEHVKSEYPVDDERVYLTGYSMGGHGSWRLAEQTPEGFAAVAPISGWLDTKSIEKLKNIPIWNFHGQLDETVPFKRSEEIVNKLNEIGGDIKFTAYPDAGHGVMLETYQNTALYEWFLAHRRKKS